MKLHRIFAILLCLAALAFAGAQAEQEPGIYAGEEHYTFIRDKEGNICLDFSDIEVTAADEKAEVICCIYGEDPDAPVFGPEAIEVSEDGKIGTVAAGQLQPGCEYRMTLQLADDDENIADVTVEVTDFVVYEISEEEKDRIAVYYVEANRYEILLYSDASSYDWNFFYADGFDEPTKRGFAETIDGIDDIDNNKTINYKGSTFNTNLGFKELVSVFKSGDDYQVVFQVRVFDNEADFEAAKAEYVVEEPEDSDSYTDMNVGNDDNISAEKEDSKFTDENDPDDTTEPSDDPADEPSAEPTEEPTDEPTEEPTAEPTRKPTIEPTVEPTEETTPEPKTVITIETIEYISDEVEEVLDSDELKPDDDMYSAEVYAGGSYRLSGTYTEEPQLDTSFGEPEMEDGRWSIKIMNIQEDMDHIDVYDADDSENKVTCNFDFLVDEAEIELEPVHEGDTAITGITDAGADVRLYIYESIDPEFIMADDESIDPEFRMADDNGSFAFEELEVSEKDTYRINVMNKYGSQLDVFVEVLPYEGDDVEIVLSSSCNRDDSEGIYSEADIQSLEIAAEAEKEAEIELLIRRVGEEEWTALGTLAAKWSNLQGKNKGSLSISDDMADAKDGEYEIVAQYLKFSYNDYVSEPLVIVIDNTAPGMPVVEPVKDDAEYFFCEVEEDCTIIVSVNDEQAGEFVAVAGENSIAASSIGGIEYGDVITITAVDKAGNKSESCAVEVTASDIIGNVEMNVSPDKPDESDAIVISGIFGTVDADATAVAEIWNANSMLAEIELDVRMVEDAGDDGYFDHVMEFTHVIEDTGWFGVNKPVDIRVRISADGEEETAEKKITIAADYSLLLLPALSFAVIAIGLITAIIAFAKVTQRISNLKKAALDSENDSNLTIRRRGYSRAAK